MINNQDLIWQLVRKWTDWHYIAVYVKNIEDSVDEKVALYDWWTPKFLE